MDVPGTSVLIYDQTCAAEKRRRRKRGEFPDPNQRVFINESGLRGLRRLRRAVELRRHRAGRDALRPQAPDRPVGLQQGLFLPQGLLPELRHRSKAASSSAASTQKALPGGGAVFPVLPEPERPALDAPWSILITGIGGTGVITIGHILGMAAHIEGKGAGIIDMVGLSQKNGAVVSHLKIAAKPADIAAVRIAAGGADLILGCDLVTSASERVLRQRVARAHSCRDQYRRDHAGAVHPQAPISSCPPSACRCGSRAG